MIVSPTGDGIVPPWLTPDDPYLPVLPLPPCPPDWDMNMERIDPRYDEGDPGTYDPDIPDRDERDWGWRG